MCPPTSNINIYTIAHSQEEEEDEQDAQIASAKSDSTNWGPGFITLEEVRGVTPATTAAA